MLEALGGRARTARFDAELARRRAIKTEGEVAALTRCAEATATGQRAAPGAVRAGETELAAWRDVRLAMESFAGTRCPVAGDFVTGRSRTAGIGGAPGARVMRAGDTVICDLAPRIDGYWGDSCTSFALGEPGAAWREMYACTHRAFELVLESLRPGVSVHDFDAPIRAMIHDAGYLNPIHMGHGIGTYGARMAAARARRARERSSRAWC